MKHFSIKIIFILLFFVLNQPSLASDFPKHSDAYIYGVKFTEAINNHDSVALSELFDHRQLALLTAETITNSKSTTDSFVSGFLKADEKKLMENIFNASFSQKGQAKLLKIIHGTRPLIRIDYPEGGHEYLIITTKAYQQKIQGIDLYFLTTGRELSESLGAFSQLVARPNEPLLKKLFGTSKDNKKLLKTLKEIVKLRKSGNHTEAYRLVSNLPEKVKQERIIIDLAIQMSQFISDKEYHKQLANLYQHHGDDESTAFILIDYHFFNEEYEKAQASITALKKTYGNDAALTNLSATIYLLSRDYNMALFSAKEAKQLEPLFEDAYWTEVSVLAETERHKELAIALKAIEAQFGYQFSPEHFQGEDIYKQFTQSTEFNTWFQ